MYRFTQPDTPVPNLYASQNLNRFAYVLNKPVRYNDPSGHMCSDPEDPTPTCEGRIPPSNSVYDLVKIVDPSIVGNYPEPLEDGLVLREVDEPSSAPQALDKLWDDNSWCPDLEIGCVGEYLEYYMATFGTAIPNSITGTVVGWHISLAVDQFDQWYVGIGLDAGKNVLGVSFSIVEGRFDGNQLPEDDKGEKAFIESFLTGNSLQGFLVPIMYLGANYSLSGKKTAFEIGLGVPQAGGAWTYSFNLSKFVNQIEGASR